MEVLYLNEADVGQLLSMETALAAVEEGMRHWAAGTAVNQSRQRLAVPPKTYLHYMAAAEFVRGYFGMKLYTAAPTGIRFLVPLYRAETGELLALLEADRLGCVRTGAASGLATRYLARADATRVGILGTGHQAPTQLEAIAAVRRIQCVRVYSRDPARRQKFARAMTDSLGIEVEAVDSAEQAVREAAIVITVTTARAPVLRGEWLAAGTHLNAVGANFPQRRELDDVTLARVSRLVVDSREQSQREAGDLIIPFTRDPHRWEQVDELHQVITDARPGRRNQDEITLFKSNGIALWDVATAARVYELAQARGVGRKLPMWVS
ncbi:MAG: ornithine cyclodeaminase family protein [Terriglobia bacterium]